MLAYVKRFIKSCKRRNSAEAQLGALEPQELADAGDHWVRKAQSNLHQRLQKGELATLTPFIDGNRIIRFGVEFILDLYRVVANMLHCFPKAIGSQY